MSAYQDQYLGDGVYASHDGYHIWLDTRAQFQVHRIALEPSVFKKLIEYADGIRALQLAEPPIQSECEP